MDRRKFINDLIDIIDKTTCPNLKGNTPCSKNITCTECMSDEIEKTVRNEFEKSRGDKCI